MRKVPVSLEAVDEVEISVRVRKEHLEPIEAVLAAKLLRERYEARLVDGSVEPLAAEVSGVAVGAHRGKSGAGPAASGCVEPGDATSGSPGAN